MRFHFTSFSYMSTLHVDLNLSRFKCVFAYKVAPYFILIKNNNNNNKLLGSIVILGTGRFQAHM